MDYTIIFIIFFAFILLVLIIWGAKKWGIMQVGGIVGIAAGVILLGVGFWMNGDQQLVSEYLWKYGRTNPGSPYITVGIIVLVIGVILLVLKYVQKMQKPPQ